MQQYNKNIRFILVIAFSMTNGSFGMDAAGEGNPEFQTLVANSKRYRRAALQFPKEYTSIEILGKDSLEKQAEIVDQAKKANILVHDKILGVCTHYLNYKRKNGTLAEQDLYETMTVPGFVERLIKCRPATFYKATSYEYVFRDGEKFSVPTQRFDQLAGHQGNEGVLRDYISRDEIEISAFFGLISPTFFINSGHRENRCEVNHNGEAYQQEGFFAGLVGACFETRGWLEYKYMVITKEQNTADRGYGLDACNEKMLAIHSKIYGLKFPTYEQAQKDITGRYISVGEGAHFFDKSVYEIAIDLRVDPFLNAAHRQAKENNKKAYARVVGLGLGVWEIDPRQGEWMVDVYTKIIKGTDLSSISDIDFIWFERPDNPYKNDFERAKREIIAAGVEKKIAIHFSEHNPATELTEDDKDKILFTMYAGDANSASGNEFLAGKTKCSGDPAAACCSTIAELLNPWINPYLRENIVRTVEKMMQDYKIDDNGADHGVEVTSASEEDHIVNIEALKEPKKNASPSSSKEKKMPDGGKVLSEGDGKRNVQTNHQPGSSVSEILVQAATSNADRLFETKNMSTPGEKPKSASWNNKWMVIGGVGVLGVLAAAIIYYFRGEISDRWHTMPNFGLSK